MPYNPCVDVATPEAIAEREMIKKEDTLVSRVLEDPRLHEWFKQEGGEELTRNRARQFVGDLGRYTAGWRIGDRFVSAEIPTEFQLREAARRLKLMQKMRVAKRTPLRRLVEQLILPWEHFGRYPFLDETKREQIDAARWRRQATKLITDLIHNVSFTFNDVMSTEQSFLQRPQKVTDRRRGLGTPSKERWQELATIQGEASNAVRDVESMEVGQVMQAAYNGVISEVGLFKGKTGGQLRARKKLWKRYNQLRDAEKLARKELVDFSENTAYGQLSKSFYEFVRGEYLDPKNLASPQVVRAEIQDRWARQFGASGKKKLMAAVDRVIKEQAQLFQIAIDSVPAARRAARLRLINFGVSKRDANEAAKLFFPDIKPIDLEAGQNFIHEIKLGPFAAKVRRREKRAEEKDLGFAAIGGRSGLDWFVEEWQAHLAEGNKIEFMDYLESYRKKNGDDFFSLAAGQPGALRERAVEIDPSDPAGQPYPDVLTALESYGAQIQHFAYRSRMDHSYELARTKIRELREASMKAPGDRAVRDQYVENLDALKDYINRHQADVLLSHLTNRDEKWRNIFHATLAMQTFSKIGFNLKTVTQNTSQLFMLFGKFGIAGIREGLRYMNSDEGKRLMRREALDWDASTASYLVHKEDALFQKHMMGMKPDRWDQKMLAAGDFMVSKTGSLWMLGKSELKLHEIAFATAFKRARDSIGQDARLKNFFENLPNHIEARQGADPKFDRAEFLRRFGLREADLEPENWQGKVPGADEIVEVPRKLWETRLEKFIAQKAIDVAHDARIFINGDYSTAGRPQLFRTNWGKLIFQFRLFDVIFGNYVGQSVKQLGRRLKGGRAPIEGEEQAKLLGFETPEQVAWGGRMVTLLALLPFLSGFVNADVAGWMEPGTVRLFTGLADWYSGDEDQRRYAFYGKGPASQLVGPAISDVMDLVHWGVFEDLRKDNELARFFFGTQVWSKLPEWKQEKDMLRKVNSSAATARYNAWPLAERGQVGEALWTMGFTPAYEKRKELDELRKRVSNRESALNVLSQVVKTGRPL